MKFIKIFLSLVLFVITSCGDGAIIPANTYVPDTVSEFSIAGSVAKMGMVNTADGKENIVVIFPVTGVKIKDGKINVNQDVSVTYGAKTVDEKTDIYGSKGLTIDVLKMGGNPNLTFAGVELSAEVIPPPELTGTLLINITVRDLNSPGSVAKITRGFRSDKAPNPYAKPCIPTVVPSPSATSPSTIPIKLCSNDIIKTYTSENAMPYFSGVEKTSEQKELDPSLIGKWELFVPGFTWYSELKTIKTPDLNFDNPAPKPLPPGTLFIFQNKDFIWQKNDETTQGIMEQVIPRSYADPKITYWKIYSGKNNFYIYSRNGTIFINELESHLYSLTGKKAS